ncbi:hypothetical protein D9757_007929 [Collybiopsis confluens]|uniref:Uncharacterized protein n=1 Tax=Collybiopsis confluens TaxID=2823264 RepID=A0A8H5HBP9_9AGAR|nr:hypothetical protein D9757_007929 [Collybiopsis confluens]
MSPCLLQNSSLSLTASSSSPPTWQQTTSSMVPLVAELSSPSYRKGNFTDSKTGELVANLLPNLGGGFGINSTIDAKFYVDAAMVMQFVDDNQYAYLKLNGIGSTAGHASSFFLLMETASAARQDLAGKFIIFSNLFLPADASPANETLAYFRMFAKTSPEGSYLGQ